MTTTVLSVPEISCGACRSAIETAVAPTAGVQSVEVDLDTKTVTVHHDQTVSLVALSTPIEDQGYDVADTHEQVGRGDQQ
ncbi:heavy-metal-associated domain-containing protein [Amycolatopsis sp. K13G38]|uniref:Heavy-metal-associated domain-containing protein n=1 Tax=Amycolatopsis acididurans TaxID=2724524 RepID=A0ABX1J7L1_9PSEU|nr:cation transporter [Amycolatopsis acididurans]NKQ55649.1 heavy-metal-associated domain-containing protein [Amycolatopsis acididurans]